jgi:hypothetical protein
MQKTAKKPIRPGRPSLPEGEVRNKRLDDVRFSEAELEKLKGIAAKAGKGWTDWVRGKLGL